MPTMGWKATGLWKELAGRGDAAAEAVRATLLLILPKAEQILDKGGTAETDFTLHDADHAFRVAEWMCRLMPAAPGGAGGTGGAGESSGVGGIGGAGGARRAEIVAAGGGAAVAGATGERGGLVARLSTYELALLLLAAYLHDIGMMPKQAKIRAVFAFFAYGRADGLQPDEQTDLQHWQDEQGYSRESSGSVPDLVARASEITTAYARHRHNEWSAEWMRTELSSFKLGSYNGWLADLVMLCGSHHVGRDELLDRAFNPRLVGSSGDMVHLRYLAALLRVADVLDFDPERTPEVILRHREVRESSRIFWWKDAAISTTLQGDRIIVSARPASARIHRAIIDTIEQVEAELRLCRELDDLTHFDTAPAQDQKLPHRWTMHTTVGRDVEPAQGSYVFIDGAFRPDVKRVLALLSGTQLYENPLAAVRELLQNAFDAVREEMAHLRLRLPNPADPELELTLAKSRRVELRLENTPDGGQQLVCSDNGSGMTRRIIERNLLVGGATARPEIQELERRSRAAGFRTGRTGQFGIGVLSYFMLASSIRVETRRSAEAGDSDATGWVFESDGLSDFGELRPMKGVLPGTKVTLRLRHDAVAPVEEIARRLVNYIKNLVLCAPCELSVSTPDAQQAWRTAPGWTNEPEFLDTAILCALTDVRARGRFKGREAQTKIAVRSLHFAGLLPAGMGRYRAAVPFFDLPDGQSLVWIDKTVDDRVPQWSREMLDGCVPIANIVHAWKGMALAAADGSQGILSFGRVQIDWIDEGAGVVAVHRNLLRLAPSGLSALQEMGRQVRERLAECLVTPGNPFATLNAALLETPISPLLPQQWPFRSIASHWMLKLLPVSLPAIEIHTSRHLRTMSGQSICGVPPIYLPTGERGPVIWSSAMPLADHVLDHKSLGPMPTWTRNAMATGERCRRALADFPPTWLSVVAVVLGYTYWNRASAWTQAGFESLDEIEAARSHAAAGNIWRQPQNVSGMAALLLNTLEGPERMPVLLDEAAAIDACVRAGLVLPIAVWHPTRVKGLSDRPFLRVLSPDGVRTVSGEAEIRRFIPPAPDDWRIIEEPDEPAPRPRRRRPSAKRTRSKGR